MCENFKQSSGRNIPNDDTIAAVLEESKAKIRNDLNVVRDCLACRRELEENALKSLLESKDRKVN